MRLRPTAVITVASLVAMSAGGVAAPRAQASPATTAWGAPVACGDAASPTIVERTYGADRARSYDYVPVEVPPGTARFEVGYRWADAPMEPVGIAVPSTPLTATTFDLGLWSGPIDDDANLVGWSGSRQGRLDQGRAPVWVAAESADRGYRPVDPNAGGTWAVEVGVAAVADAGATVHLEISCLDSAAADADPRTVRARSGRIDHDAVATGDCDDAVVPTPVEDFDEFADVTVLTDIGEAVVTPGTPGCWLHADLHLHGYHSNPSAPDWDGVIAQARAAGLDVIPITEYVTTAHWDELAAVAAANPDLVIWPGREVITYFGHSIVLSGPGRAAGGDAALAHDVDFRHGLDPDGDGPAGPIGLDDIQADARAAGDLFGVAHPTIFPGPAFGRFCRGCAFELDDVVDWSAVSTMEVVTGPVLADLSDLAGQFPSTHSAGLSAQNPFVDPAIDLWEDRLAAGFKIAPVSGSDSKGVDALDQRNRKGYGSSVTEILATERSVAAVRDAVAAGRVYVRTRGVDESPTLDMVVAGVAVDDLHRGTFGSVLPVAAAMMVVEVAAPAGGSLNGQVLRLVRNGTVTAVIPLAGASQRFRLPITRVVTEERAPDPGGVDLGTSWRVDVADARSLTAIGNAVFLTGDVSLSS